MKRKVTKLRVHDMSTLLDGFGNITGNELPVKNKHIPGLEMQEGDIGVEVRLPGVPEIQVIPYTNIQKYNVIVETAPVTRITPKSVIKEITN